MYFEYWQSSHDRKWYFHGKALNHERILQSEGYTTERACLDTIEVIKKNAKDAKVTKK